MKTMKLVHDDLLVDGEKKNYMNLIKPTEKIKVGFYFLCSLTTSQQTALCLERSDQREAVSCFVPIRVSGSTEQRDSR